MRPILSVKWIFAYRYWLERAGFRPVYFVRLNKPAAPAIVLDFDCPGRANGPDVDHADARQQNIFADDVFCGHVSNPFTCGIVGQDPPALPRLFLTMTSLPTLRRAVLSISPM